MKNKMDRNGDEQKVERTTRGTVRINIELGHSFWRGTERKHCYLFLQVAVPCKSKKMDGWLHKLQTTKDNSVHPTDLDLDKESNKYASYWTLPPI